MNPLPTVFVTGQGSVNGDMLNTFVQVVQNFAQLRTFSALNDMSVYVLGGAAEGDGLQGQFWWNGYLINPVDNNATVIVPYGNIQGAWLRLAVSLPSNSPVRLISTGTSDALLASDNTVVWYSTSLTPKTETLPAPTVNGQTFTVKDGAAGAAPWGSAYYNITIITASGSIVGSNVINVNGNSLTFRADGVSNWLVI